MSSVSEYFNRAIFTDMTIKQAIVMPEDSSDLENLVLVKFSLPDKLTSY